MSLSLPAPSTTEPVRCPHFGPCGGCTSLDLPYGEEVRAKEEKLRTAFSRHEALARAPILPILGATEPLLYRNSIKVPFGWSREGMVAGFFERRSHHIVDLETCLIQHPKLTALLLATKQIAMQLKIAIHDPASGRGILRHLVARIGEGTGEMLAGLVVQAQGYGKIRGLALKLMEKLGKEGLVGVVQNIHADDEDHAILGPETLPLAGRAYLDENSDGLKMRTSLQSFVQVNAAQAHVLYGEVLRLLDGSFHAQGRPNLEGKRIVDLFCGVGPIALRAARAGALVEGIEYSEDAVRSARFAAKHNGLESRVAFHAGDATQHLDKLSAKGPIDAVVVDPPRRGLSEKLIASLIASSTKQVVYVSCDPFTFARDLTLLSERFEIAVVRPIDLFPRTLHLETVALLRRP
ncbi:MAG: 23S rRNA (uracil(1939)-C(5))-methyltransferase RlmD [Planctomycetes bacterium]|nr:23S rRNA (uracil(1939)-C(5))-methyltransferase RlmD [Planctomycetota bacterium]